VTRTLDRLDRRILEELQADARISNQGAGEARRTIARACWRRLRRLEEAGFNCRLRDAVAGAGDRPADSRVRRRLARKPSPESVRQFDQLVKERPEVLECHSMSGAK